MSTLGRVHGIFFAVKQSSPALYSEFLSTLGLDGDRGRLPAAGAAAGTREEDEEEGGMVRRALADAAKEVGADEARLKRQMASLGSPHSALPFSIINHGNLRYARCH